MRRIIICLILLVGVISTQAQGFKKIAKVEKISTHELGNYRLYKHQTENDIVYSFDMRDRKYSSKTFLQVKLGNKDEAISFFESAIETIDSMKKGDRFELGFGDHIGFYINQMGVKKLGITVGDIGEYGELPKNVINGMLNRLKKE